MHLSAEHIKALHKYDIKVLQSIEYLMRSHEWVPAEDISHNTRLSDAEVEYRARNLVEKGMIKYTQQPYPGYSLVFNGYDTLAISYLSQKKMISALGSLIGVGKESLIYEAVGIGPVILKLHRVGQRSFQNVRKNRGFLPDGHCPWIFASHLSAEQEFEALSRLRSIIPVPQPIGINRNVIVMAHLGMVNLSTCSLHEPERVFNEIIDQISRAYQAGFIHGDLSEFNVMTDGSEISIIDWPQWVSPDHENGREILDHDIRTISQFFRKKYNISLDPEEIRSRVIG